MLQSYAFDIFHEYYVLRIKSIVFLMQSAYYALNILYYAYIETLSFQLLLKHFKLIINGPTHRPTDQQTDRPKDRHCQV